MIPLMNDLYVEDAELCNEIVQRLLRDNPKISLGAHMKAPIMLTDGRGNTGEKKAERQIPVTAQSIKISLPFSDALFKLSDDASFIHPYKCLRCNWTHSTGDPVKVGDSVRIIDQTTLEEKETIVTDEMVNAFSHALFRFGTS